MGVGGATEAVGGATVVVRRWKGWVELLERRWGHPWDSWVELLGRDRWVWPQQRWVGLWCTCNVHVIVVFYKHEFMYYSCMYIYVYTVHSCTMCLCRIWQQGAAIRQHRYTEGEEKAREDEHRE